MKPTGVASIALIVVLLVSSSVVAQSAPSKKPGGFGSPNIAGGQSWDLVLPSAGTYRYFCVPHPGMRGTIEVATNTTARSGTVEIKGFRFQPSTVWVAPNGTITFTNQDTVVHTATETTLDQSGDDQTPAPSFLVGVIVVLVAAIVLRTRR